MAEIAILGGGPGGLTLVRILQTRGISATIYEREESADVRSQGGSLDIHTDSGQKALEVAGLIDEFTKLARREGQDQLMMDKTAKPFLELVSDSQNFSRPEIDRPVLRNLLLKSVNPDSIKWSHNLKTISSLENRKHTLTFENGASVKADLVVGADGAWSRIRPLITSATPTYSGVSFIEGNIPAPSPALNKFVGRGTLSALSENKGLFAQRNGDESVRVYIALRVSEDWLSTCAIPFDDLPQARARFLEIFADWSPSITDLLRECTGQFLPRPIFALPVGLSWTTKPNVTLLGDAAHLMSPFAGEGVNLAMTDAMELALAIANNPTDIFEALRTYETGMFPRVEHAARESADNMDLMFAADAPQSITTKLWGTFAPGTKTE